MNFIIYLLLLRVITDETSVYAGLAVFVIAEIGNLVCHLILSGMRPSGDSKKRDVPTGFLFELVSCPNYTCEVASWIGFTIMMYGSGMTCSLSGLFTLVGALQMGQWAMKKHKGYLKQDDRYKERRRKAIVPFIY